MTQQLLLARQPIFDINLNVKAYELLYRAEYEDRANVLDGDQATSHVLLCVLTALDLTDLIGNTRAFVNFTRNILIEPPPFNRDQIVIEILEGMTIDDQLLASIYQLKKQGHTIALDDFFFNENTELLVHLADIVKLDVLALGEQELIDHVAKLKKYHLTLLAEKVETHEMFEHCKKLGFELFQGYFLCKPRTVIGKAVPLYKFAVLALINKLYDPNIKVNELENIIAQDPALSYKLLRLVNSAAFRRMQQIDSLRHAITLLGMDHIKTWATLMSLTGLSEKPHELGITAMIRASMCGYLAEKAGLPNPEMHFTAGLLSTLDAFLDSPLKELLKNLSLSAELSAALLNYEGILGLVLQTTLLHEQGKWMAIKWTTLDMHHITPQIVEDAYMQAVHWAREIDAGNPS